MRKLYTMKNLVKGLMLSVAIALGATTAQAQDNGTGTGTGTGTEDVKPAASTEFWMGEEAAEGMFYLYNVGAKIFVTGNTPSETDINKATLWTASESDKSYSFTDEKGNLVITMNSLSAKITEKGRFTIVTKFGLETGTTEGKGNAYKLAYSQLLFQTRYFNVDKDKYTPATTPGDFNDWLFISDAQKKAYTEYVNLFNKAKSYTEKGSKLLESKDYEKTDPIVKQINDALKSYNYNTYKKENGGKAKLDAAIKAAEDFISSTTGINEIGSTTDAKVSEIYGVNGARKSQLTKGLNIVKMSDGTVKKVLVK